MSHSRPGFSRLAFLEYCVQWEKFFASSSSETGLPSRIYKELWELNTERTNNPINKWAKELNKQFSKEVQMTNKYRKKCSVSLARKEMQFKVTLRFHLTPVRMAVLRK
jgi:hypothetical protein